MAVKDRNNYYYTELLNALKAEDAKVKGGTEYKVTPPSFPYMYYKQIGGSTAASSLSNTEDGIMLAIEILIYSKKSLDDARKLANADRAYLVSKGFHIDEFKPVDNVADSSIHQFLIRCSKIET